MVVSLLRQDSTREQVLELVREQNTTVAKFVQLLVGEEAEQRKELEKARDEVTVIDDKQCR